MVKLVCPACGWSDFLKYKDDSSWHCQCCGMEYSDAEVKTFEKEVPESEYNGYGTTVIDIEKEEFYEDFIENYDYYYTKYKEGPNCMKNEIVCKDCGGTEFEDSGDGYFCIVCERLYTYEEWVSDTTDLDENG